MRRVVSNTGPVLHLIEAATLHLLALTGEVSIPPAVDTELALHVTGWSSARPSWLAARPLAPAAEAQALSWEQAGLLDAGEAEAVALARQVSSDWLLTDDAAARLFAQTLGLEVHGSIGIVLWAAGQGHLTRPAAGAALEALAQSSLWVSPVVLAQAKAALAALTGTP